VSEVCLIFTIQLTFSFLSVRTFCFEKILNEAGMDRKGPIEPVPCSIDLNPWHTTERGIPGFLFIPKPPSPLCATWLWDIRQVLRVGTMGKGSSNQFLSSKKKWKSRAVEQSLDEGLGTMGMTRSLPIITRRTDMMAKVKIGRLEHNKPSRRCEVQIVIFWNETPHSQSWACLFRDNILDLYPNRAEERLWFHEATEMEKKLI